MQRLITFVRALGILVPPGGTLAGTLAGLAVTEHLTEQGLADPMSDRREKRQDGGFAQRLREVVNGYGSASTLARTIDRSEGAVRKWLRGESEPNVTDLRSVCEETRTSVDWLVTGRGTQQEASGVQERPASYQAASGHQIDHALLESILVAIEGELERSGLPLSSAKRSVMAAMLYEQCLERGVVDPEAVARLVRLAG